MSALPAGRGIASIPDAGYSVETGSAHRTLTIHRAEGPRLAIQGSLEEAPLPDVIQLLSLGRKTGCLSLIEREMEGEICLEEGRICHAAVFGRRDRLGDMLVRTGRITQDDLEHAIAAQHAGGKRVSQALLESGQVGRTELEEFVARQVEEAVYFMFTWRTGSFAFTSTAEPKRQDIPVSIDPEVLLLEGARRVDEWSLIEKRIPSLDLVFRIDRARLDAATPALTREQNQIIPLIDGCRDVHGLIQITGMAEFTVGKALFGLITAGFAQRIERRSSMRHLDYREMLAYVVREAEFADPEERRAAARHIADCATCTQRLKTIHVRRTGAVPAVKIPLAADAAPEEEDVKAGAATATLPPPGIERRAGDRRTGQDRRDLERRHAERRVGRSAEWERPGRERRSGGDRRRDARRIAERRLASGDDWHRAGAAVAGTRALAGHPRARADRRSTGPRRIRPRDAGADASKRDTGDGIHLRPIDDSAESSVRAAERQGSRAPRAAAEEAVEAPPRKPARASRPAKPPVEVTPPTTPTARRSRPDPEIPEPPVEIVPVAPPVVESADPGALAPPESPAPRSQPTSARRPARTTDIDGAWVMSPKEANRLLRESRQGLAGTEPLEAPAAEEPAVEPAPPEPATPAARRSMVKPATRRTAAAVRDASRPVPRRPPPQARPALAPAAAVVRAEARQRPRLGRWLGAAAVLALLAGSAWVARPFLGFGAGPMASAPATPQAGPPAGTVSQGGQAAQTPMPDPAPTPPETPVARTPERPPASPATTRPAEAVPVAQPPVRESAPPTAPAPAPVPAAGIVRGVVRDAGSGTALAGVRVTIPGTGLAALTDANGAFALPDVPAGRIAVTAAFDGRVNGRREVVLERGATMQVDFTLAQPEPVRPAEPAAAAQPTATPPARPLVAPVPRETDAELATGGWTVTDHAAATTELKNGLATIPDLWIESIAVSESGSRPRVRVALLTPTGERIVLTETRSGAPALGTPRVTALRIIPASEAYPVTTGTVSFGSLLVTAKTALPGDELRALLARLAPLGE